MDFLRDSAFYFVCMEYCFYLSYIHFCDSSFLFTIMYFFLKYAPYYTFSLSILSSSFTCDFFKRDTASISCVR